MPSNAEIVRFLYEEADRTGDPVEGSPYFSENFTLVTYPTNVGWPDMDKKGYLEHVANVRGTTIKGHVKVAVTEVIDAGNKVIMHVSPTLLQGQITNCHHFPLKSTAIKPMKDGSDMHMDRIRIYTFNEEGKIVHCKQFVDSLAISKRSEKYKPES
ncbi:hypothetical protein DL96DRAFT_1615413 [Flagelloscypha sp. PMI_526]|nr:hypothetical protein DL96DRAFT_1615413 [Flagelloscypha sp. PMI_526]